MPNARIKDLPVTAASTASDDYLVLDGVTNGTRKLAASPAFILGTGGIITRGIISGAPGTVFRSDAGIEIQNNDATKPAILSIINVAVNPGDTTHEAGIIFGGMDSTGNCQKLSAITGVFLDTTHNATRGKILFHASYLTAGVESNDEIIFYGNDGLEYMPASATVGPGASTFRVPKFITTGLTRVQSNLRIESSDTVPSTGKGLEINYLTTGDKARIMSRDRDAAAYKPLELYGSTILLSGALTASLATGSAAAPSLNFSGDATTGLYALGASYIGVSLGGALKFAFNSSWLTVASTLTAANGTVATTLGSKGPVGSTAGDPQGWLHFSVGGTDRYVPFW